MAKIMRVETNIGDKIKGALFAAAIGDAMGATTEFMSAKEIAKKYGKVTDIIGGGWLDLPQGDVTDDTEMAVCVMKALMIDEKIHGKPFVQSLADRFIAWKLSNPKDMGLQTHKAIARMIEQNILIQPVETHAQGNGALIRSLPCCLLPSPANIEYALVQGKMTHNSQLSNGAIKIYCNAVQGYLHNNIKLIPRTPRYEFEPLGRVSNTVANALYYTWHSDTIEEGITWAVNAGGDADSIAFVTGGLLGAKFGYSNIPERWIDQLNPEVKHDLEMFADFLYENYYSMFETL